MTFVSQHVVSLLKVRESRYLELCANHALTIVLP